MSGMFAVARFCDSSWMPGSITFALYHTYIRLLHNYLINYYNDPVGLVSFHIHNYHNSPTQPDSGLNTK